MCTGSVLKYPNSVTNTKRLVWSIFVLAKKLSFKYRVQNVVESLLMDI